MSKSNLNNDLTRLQRIHPFIIKKDKDLYKNYLKAQLKSSSKKKIVFLKSNLSKNINIKELISPKLNKQNKFTNTFYSSDSSTNFKNINISNKNQDNNVFNSYNNFKNFPNIKSNIFTEEYNSKESYMKSIIHRNSCNNLNFKNNKIKINKSTNISPNFNFIETNKDIKDIKENKVIYTEKSEKVIVNNNRNRSIDKKLKKLIPRNKKFPFQSYFYQNNNNNKNNEKVRLDFLNKVKFSNPKISDNIMQYNFFYRTIYNNKKKYSKNKRKKDEIYDSLDDNSIWNEYTKIERQKSESQIKEKKKLKEDMIRMIKLFKNNYSYKKYKNIKKNKKEKYLDFLDDQYLALRANIIKNNLQKDRGGKQNLRLEYNPLDK